MVKESRTTTTQAEAFHIAKALNADGIPSPRGKRWLKTTVHKLLVNESYTGTLIWGLTDKSGAPPVRVEEAFPAIVSRAEFERVSHSLQARAPERVHPPGRPVVTC